MFHITRTRRAVHFPLETASQKGHWPWRHWRRYRASGPYFSWNQLFLWSINHKKKQKETLLFQANTSSFSSVSRSLRWLTPEWTTWREGAASHTVMLVVRHWRVLFSILVGHQNETFESTLQTGGIWKLWIAFRFRVDGKHLITWFPWVFRKHKIQNERLIVAFIKFLQGSVKGIKDIYSPWVNSTVNGSRKLACLAFVW